MCSTSEFLFFVYFYQRSFQIFTGIHELNFLNCPIINTTFKNPHIYWSLCVFSYSATFKSCLPNYSATFVSIFDQLQRYIYSIGFLQRYNYFIIYLSTAPHSIFGLLIYSATFVPMFDQLQRYVYPTVLLDTALHSKSRWFT